MPAHGHGDGPLPVRGALKAGAAITVLLLALVCLIGAAAAGEVHRRPPAVSIIIDDLGNRLGSGARTVALTNFPKSPITAVADLVLTTAARETTFRSGAMASRLAQLTVIDCVFVGVAQRTYDETRAALDVTYEAVSGRRLGPPRRRG